MPDLYSTTDSTDHKLSKTSIGEAGVEQLSNAVIWAYSVPKIAVGIMGILFTTYLMKFATDVLLIAPAVMGVLIAASRAWDAVSDPLVGYLSDNTQSRFGRRRIWIFASAIPMGLGLMMIWSPPQVLDGIMIVLWMALALFIYETASTAFFVPYGALGVELTPNYHERTRLYGYSHMIGAGGSLLGLVSLYLLDSSEDKRATAMYLSMIAGFCVMVLIIGATAVLPEREEYQGRGTGSPYQAFSDIFRNPHALLLLTVYGIETFGAASTGLLVPYIVSYVIPMELMPVSPSMFMVTVLVAYTVPQFIFIPYWIKLASRFGKKKLWLSSMCLAALCFIGYFFALDKPWLIWCISFLLGVSGGIAAVVAPSIKADIIDYDEFTTGERKEGAYYAVWNMVRKGAASLTAVITGVVLQSVGFEPNAVQSENAQYVLRVLFSFLPATGYLIGALLFVRFSFNEPEHAIVRQELQRRNP